MNDTPIDKTGDSGDSGATKSKRRSPTRFTPGPEALVLDLKAAAEHTGIPPWTLRALVWEGKLATVKLPSAYTASGVSKRVLFHRRDLDAFLDRCRQIETTD